MKREKQNQTTPIVLVGLTSIAIILGILLFQSGTISFPTLSPKPTTITKDSKATAMQFLAEAMPIELQPKDLTFQFAEKGNQVKGDAYVANWRAGTKSFSILVGLDSKNKTAAYLRIWTMDTAKPLPDKEFMLLPATVFAKSYIDTVGAVSCEKTSVTVCPKMTSVVDGSLRGITVRSPITLNPPPETTPPPGSPTPPTVSIVSACWVSAAAASLYPHSSCI